MTSRAYQKIAAGLQDVIDMVAPAISEAQKLRIAFLLGTTFDEGRGCYVAGSDDASVADEAGVAWGWVAAVRESLGLEIRSVEPDPPESKGDAQITVMLPAEIVDEVKIRAIRSRRRTVRAEILHALRGAGYSVTPAMVADRRVEANRKRGEG